MVGLEFLWSIYENSGPALQIILILGGATVLKYELLPRLDELETTQENRDDRWTDQSLNAQERAMLIDDAHGRVDDVSETMSRLKDRVRALEHAHAAEHGRIGTEDRKRRSDD
jgi:hypothetical protein